MRILLLLSLAVCLPTAGTAADLLDVYQLARENDTQLRAAYHARDAVRQNKPLARSLLLPQLDGSATYGIERTEISGGEEDSTDVFEPYDYGLDLSQVVFDLTAFLRQGQAGDEVAVAETEYRAEEQALIFRTTAAYFNVLGALDDLRFARAENEAVDQQRKQAEGRFRAGIAAYTDVQEAQAQYDLTRAAILAAERRLQSSHQLLTAIVGKAGLDLKTLREEIPLPSPLPDDPDVWVQAAFESNLDLLSARIRAEIAERDVDLRWSAYAPSVRLEAGQRFGRTSGFNRGDFDSRAVLLNLDVPLFAGLSRRAGVRQSKSLHEQSLAELEGTRRQVERVTRDAFLGVTSGVAQVNALRQAVASNQVALEATEAGLRVGTRTIVDVLNFQRILFQAERDYARARYDYLLSVLLLKEASGRLQPNDLAEINALLREDGC
jgi:outer membrane protein